MSMSKQERKNGGTTMKERSNWIAHEGSGHNFVEYVIVLCCISIVAAVVFGAIGGDLNGMYQGFTITLPFK